MPCAVAGTLELGDNHRFVEFRYGADDVGLAVAVLSRRRPGQDPLADLNSEPAAGDVLPVHDPGHFAIRSDLFPVVMAAVVGDFEDFVSEVFRPTLARENIQLANS